MAKELRDRFVGKYGTARCHDLQARFFGRFFNLYDPAELEAAFRGGMLDTCSNVVGEVARMTVAIILEKRAAERARAQFNGPCPLSCISA